MVRQARRDLSAAEDREALKAALDRANEAGRAARHGVLAEVSNDHRRHHHGTCSSSGDERERRYIHSDEEEQEDQEQGSGLSGGRKGGTNRAVANRGAKVSRTRSERRADEEETLAQERSGLVREEGRRSGGSSVDEQHGLQDVFCATRRGLPKAEEGEIEKLERRGEEAQRRRHGGRRVESADDSSSGSPSLAVLNSGQSKSPETAVAIVESSAKETRSNAKPRDDKRRLHRHRDSSEEDELEPSLSLPPPPRVADAHGGSSGEDRVDQGRSKALEITASHSENKRREAVEPPRPPPPAAGSSPPPRGGTRIQSFSSSNGSGGAPSPSGKALPPGAVGVSEGRVGIDWSDVDGRPAAARTPSCCEDKNGETTANAEEERTRTKAPATLVSLAADLDEGGGHVDGDGGEKAEDSASSPSLPAATPPGGRSGKFLSLSATARAVAVLTAQIEKLAQSSAPATGRTSPASLLVLEAYRSVTGERRDAATWGAEVTAAVAAAATTPADDARSSSLPPDVEKVGMVALCGAVLDLVTANATELLPAEALSGIVTAAKVRAQHRRGGKAGRVQLFDAVMGHARRLCSAPKAASGGEASRGAVDAAIVADVFITCFEAVITAGAGGNDAESRATNARGAERLRRKVFALLESAADPNGASTKTRQILSTEVATAAIGPGGMGGDGAGSEKSAGEAKVASESIESKEERQQQQGRWGSSTSDVKATLGGVVLGGGGRSMGSKKKKGGRLDLSSFGGSVAVFDTAAGHGGGLPEFEVRRWSQRGTKVAKGRTLPLGNPTPCF